MLLEDVCISTCEFTAKVDSSELPGVDQESFGLDYDNTSVLDIEATLFYHHNNEPPLLSTISLSLKGRGHSLASNHPVYQEVLKLVKHDWEGRRPDFN